MNNEKLYEIWKQQNKTMEVPQEFGEKVMDRIGRHEEQKRSRIDAGEIIERIFTRRLAKVTVFAGAAILGLIRMLFVLGAVLR